MDGLYDTQSRAHLVIELISHSHFKANCNCSEHLPFNEAQKEVARKPHCRDFDDFFFTSKLPKSSVFDRLKFYSPTCSSLYLLDLTTLKDRRRKINFIAAIFELVLIFWLASEFLTSRNFTIGFVQFVYVT